MEKIPFDEFMDKASALLIRVEQIELMRKEANELLKSLDIESLDEHDEDDAEEDGIYQREEAFEMAWDIARAAGWNFEGLEHGYWKASTC